jgi:hypothetical protein
MTVLAARGIRAAFRADTGLLDGFTVTDGGRDIAPLHRAPWVGTHEAMPDDAAPLMARLGGDFFCAPFGGSEDHSPLHGWPANAPWTVTRHNGGALEARLGHLVQGATLTKTLYLMDDHPFVYQTHRFDGGTGRIPVANHANVSVKNGALIRTSPKRCWETPRDPQESDPARGRSQLKYPARTTDPTAFPGLADAVDLTRYPWGSRHEDFVVGVEAAGSPLGWTAVTRPVEGDLFLSLRNPHALPMTMFWHSNGGRDYAPWSGRHFGCLGVEEGAAAQMLGVTTEKDLAGPGFLALADGQSATVRHVIGAIAWPTGEAIASVAIEGGSLVVTGEGGTTRAPPFDTSFLALSSGAS